ncbi:hypothetical protein A2U01_0112360, partial [Trifolium medium]|nr:hypothetical protein [Trifolium medium]
MSTTLFDSEEENEEEPFNLAFTGICETSSNTSEEDILYEELAEAHKSLEIKWKESCL